MRDMIFPRWQGAFVALFLLADGLYLPVAPAAVHTLALGTALSVLLCFCWFQLLARLGERDFDSLCRNRLPKWLAFLLRLVIAAACIAGMALPLWRLTRFWQETSFPGIPLWAGAAVLLFVGWRIGRRGRTAVSMWAYPTVFFVGIVLIASLLISIPDCTPAYLPDVFQSFILEPPLLWPFVWLILPLLLCVQGKDLPATRACTLGVLAGGLGLCLMTLRAWLVLGAGAARLSYPVFSAAGIFSVGDFLQRGEVLFGCALALSEVARVALFMCLLLWCFQYGKIDETQKRAAKTSSKQRKK